MNEVDLREEGKGVVGQETREDDPFGSLNEVAREITRHRMRREFSEHVTPEKWEMLEETPSRIETKADFKHKAVEAGIENTGGVLGWMRRPEEPAHVRRDSEVGMLATLIHEDLHRLTDPATRAELTRSEEGTRLYEGMTELLATQACEDLRGFKPGECYPEEVAQAELVEREMGERKLRDYFFRHELPQELTAALERMARNHRA